MKKRLFVLCFVLTFAILLLSGCFDGGTSGLKYEYKSLQTGPLSGNFSGMYTVVGYEGKSKDVVIPEEHKGHSVYHIAENVFQNNTNLRSIVLPTALIDIKGNAFDGCTGLTTVYYCGSAETRERLLTIYYGNDCLLNAEWYYFSETQPTDSGNYWHYVNNKVTKW